MSATDKRFVIIAAAGLGTRMNAPVPKQFLMLNNIPCIVHTINAFVREWNNAEFIVSIPEDEFARWEKIRKKFLKTIPIKTTKGGATRFHSVKNSLKLIRESGMVAVQDACRPLVSASLLKRCYSTAKEKGNAVPAIGLNDTIRELLKDGSRQRQRSKYKIVQTPQCFSFSILKEAYKQPFNELFTDDAAVVETAGTRINLVDGDPNNFKITTMLDLAVAEKLLAEKEYAFQK